MNTFLKRFRLVLLDCELLHPCVPAIKVLTAAIYLRGLGASPERGRPPASGLEARGPHAFRDGAGTAWVGYLRQEMLRFQIGGGDRPGFLSVDGNRSVEPLQRLERQ